MNSEETDWILKNLSIDINYLQLENRGAEFKVFKEVDKYKVIYQVIAHPTFFDYYETKISVDNDYKILDTFEEVNEYIKNVEGQFCSEAYEFYTKPISEDLWSQL